MRDRPPVTVVASRLRGHAPFLVAVVLGVALRVVVTVGYRPALLFPDAFFYLRHAEPLSFSAVRPIGYSVFLQPIVLLTDSLAPIPVVQHLIGVGLAVACYAFLLHRGLPRWGATLAVLPLLLDPLQLVLEHYVLSDVLFEALLVTACLVLLWRHRPGYRALVVTGALVGVAGTVRGAGAFLLAAFLVAVLCLRLRPKKVVAFLVAAIIPLGAYVVAFHQEYHAFAVTTSGPRFLYARLAPLVQCQDPELALPRYERMLCPREPVGRRPSSDVYMWGGRWGPQYHVVAPDGMTQVQVVKDFDQRVVRAQPWTFTTASLTDFVLGFSPSRTTDVPGFPASYWLFDDHYWSLDRFVSVHVVEPSALNGTGSDRTAAQAMTTYRRWVWTPGPLMAALLLAAVATVLGLGRARRSGDRVAVGLLAGTCLLTLLTGAALSGFSWRYQLPQIPLLAISGALGVAALARGPAAGRPAPDPPARVLDRWAAALVARSRLPRGWRPALDRAVARGRLQAALAALAGVLVACVFVVLAAGSGWLFPGEAALVGGVLGALVLVTLLAARRRARSVPGVGSDGSWRDPEPEPDERVPAGR